MMSGAITRSLLLSYSLGVQPWEAGSVMRRWDRLSLTRITKTRSLVPPSATPVKLGYQIMWLALRHPEQVRDLHSKAGCSQLSAKEQGGGGGAHHHLQVRMLCANVSHLPSLTSCNHSPKPQCYWAQKL